MDNLFDFLNPKWLVTAFGTVGVLAIIFAETGLMIGFLLPGDSLLVTAGAFTTPEAAGALGIGPLSLPVLLIGAPICAIAGAQLGHYLGAKIGPRIFSRPDSRFLRQEYVAKAEYYFTKFGPAKAVVLARFIPIVRTFLNPVAGVLGMDARRFLVWNVIGGVVWTDGLLILGHYIGQIPGIDKYILPGVVVIILLSVLPIAREVRKARRTAAEHAERV